jgi:hypothetical protein
MKPEDVYRSKERNLTRLEVLVNQLKESVGTESDQGILEKTLRELNNLLRAKSSEDVGEQEVRFLVKTLTEGPMRSKDATVRNESFRLFSTIYRSVIILDDERLESETEWDLHRFLEANIEIDNENSKIVYKYKGGVTDLMRMIVEEYDLDFDRALSSWERSDSPLTYSMVFSVNIARIREIEKHREGTASQLQRSVFGINNFRRCPWSRWVQQAEQIEDTTSRYVLVAWAKDDNGSSTHLGFDNLHLLGTELNNHGINLRIAEFDDGRDLSKRLIRIDSRYGKEGNEPINTIIVVHGSGGIDQKTGDKRPDYFASGRTEKEYVRPDDLEALPEKQRKRLEQIFPDGSDILLISCHTGADDGMGQKISKLFPNQTVIAPNVATGTKHLCLKKNAGGEPLTNNGLPSVDIGYRHAEKIRYKAGQKVS